MKFQASNKSISCPLSRSLKRKLLKLYLAVSRPDYSSLEERGQEGPVDKQNSGGCRAEAGRSDETPVYSPMWWFRF